MAARENEIGKARCPLCGGTASLRVSASGLSYLAMDCCKAQLFTRGDHSDTLARGLLLKEQPAAAAPTPSPAPTPAPAPATTPEPTPAPAPEQDPAPQPATATKARGFRWGAFPTL
jgi:predicted component of type VI protein secretion system